MRRPGAVRAAVEYLRDAKDSGLTDPEEIRVYCESNISEDFEGDDSTITLLIKLILKLLPLFT